MPTIKAKITFLSEKEVGRPQMPEVNKTSRYMPHLVVQDSDIRNAIIRNTKLHPNELIEEYLGVAFVSGPTPIISDKEGVYELALMYYPKVSYEKLIKGVTFTVREGARVVGFGEVI